MDWILDNLQVILAVAGAIAYWLNARRKEQAGEPADYDGDGTPDNTSPFGRRADGMDEDDESTRRIQEEIRRKIAERQGGGVQPPAVEPQWRTPVPTQSPPQVRRHEESAPAYDTSNDGRAEVERETAAALERQRLLAEQLAALKSRRAEVDAAARNALADSGRAPAVFGAAPVSVSVSAELDLLRELRSARSLRKAIVLREVLGAPVALR